MSKILMSCGCFVKVESGICYDHKTYLKASLEGRKAICNYGCKLSVVSSETTLPFFAYKPNEKLDRYYCGCYGWD